MPMDAELSHLLFDLNNPGRGEDLARPDILEAFVQLASGDQAEAGLSPAVMRAAIDSNTGMMSAIVSIT